MAGARAGQGAEDRPAQADLHRPAPAGVRAGRGALGLTWLVTALPTPGLHRDGQRGVISAYVAAAYGDLSRLCPQCGSTAHGRPRVSGRPDLHLSVSYAEGLAVLAVADEPVGVDVEAVAGRRVAVDRRDVVEWTRLEATVKLTGQGLRGGPPRDARVVALTDLPEGYVGALATYLERA